MKRYFKGYYFKCSTGEETVAFIPALHMDGKESRASLQVITDRAAYVIPCSDIRFGSRKFGVKAGKSCFTEKGILVDVDTEGCRIKGRLKFGTFRKIRYSIMGPFQYVPFMQCRHSVVSMRHSVTGRLEVNGRSYHFQDGIGYIEGDCGRSFPKDYIWTQCHGENASVMLSVADIPFLGFHFKGIIGVITVADREYRIATYLGARLLWAGKDTVVIKQGKYRLSAKLLEANAQKLNAPVNGKMSRKIHESASCKASYEFTCKGRKVLELTSSNASFEFEMNGGGGSEE